MLDVFAWDAKGRGQGPKASFVKIACVRTWDELVHIARNPSKWRTHVKSCVKHEELAVLTMIGKRREKEVGRNWTPDHTEALIAKRMKIIAKLL